MEPESRPPRDAQRARVYRAETIVASSPLPGLDACATFADRVVGTFWWQARFPDRTLDRIPRLRPGNGARQAFLREEDDGGHSITLPRRYRTKGVVLHELVHWALTAEPDLPHHGRTFARVLLDAIGEFCGPERAGALAAAYRVHRVRLGHPPRPGPDGRIRYGWDERLHLRRGEWLTVHFAEGERDASVTGVLARFERSGTIVVLDGGGAAARIMTDAVWHVHGP